MGPEIDWVAIAAITAAACAVVAAMVCVGVWRKVRASALGASDLGKRIADGDSAVKLHADQALNAMRESVDEMSERVGDMGDAIARIETHQAAEEKHVLRPRDLGAIHEKINRAVEAIAETRAQSSAELRGLSEQVKVLQRLVETVLASTRRSY